MSENRESLDIIGLRAGTDKASRVHNYLQFYETFFAGMRPKAIRLLEIGILNGASLKVWEEYFPNATIIGADINTDTRRFETARTKVEIIDQSNAQDMIDLAVRHGPFDIIIEDGSHLWEHQITSLKLLFPFVRVGGFYVVEDLHSNYGDNVPIYQRQATISCVEYLKKLLDYKIADEKTDISLEEDYFLRTYGRAINYMTFYRHVCLIKKGQPATKGPRSLPCVLLLEPSDREIELVKINAHVANMGNVTSESSQCLNVGTGAANALQGYELVAPFQIARQLRYRARLEDGTWTEWVGGNTFVGTRGKNINLAGLAIKFGDDIRRDYQIKIAGSFSGGDVIIVGNGEDCVSPDGRGRLLGIQLKIEQAVSASG